MMLFALLLVLMVSHVGGVDFDGAGIDPLGKNQKCNRYACTDKEKEPVPKRPLSLRSSGCSSMGGAMMMMPGSGM